MAAALAALGYEYAATADGHALRQIAAPADGFAWRGQEDYEAVGAAACAWAREQLVSQCGLEPLEEGLGPACAYATPGAREHAGPLVLLVCGSKPGGDAGVWGRSLLINEGTSQGAMFDYVARAKARGWAVVVADVHADDAPHRHLVRLWDAHLERSAFSRLLVVGHSYGGPCSIGLLKAAPAAAARLGALALTDGVAWGPRGWGSIDQAAEAVPTQAELDAASEQTGAPLGELEKMRDQLARFQEAAAGCFGPPTVELATTLAERARNFVCSHLPVGTPLDVSDPRAIPTVASGTDQHPATTAAATGPLFEFLDAGAKGEAAASTAELRRQVPSGLAPLG